VSKRASLVVAPLGKPHRGFTLIELTVVIVIISLLVSAVVINTSGTMQRFHQQRWLQELISLDQRARQLCVSSGRSAVLELSSKEGQALLRYADGQWIHSERVETGAGQRWVILTGSGERDDQATISFSPAGLSELYAVGIRDDVKKTSHWVLFLGSGQMKTFQSQEDLDRWIDQAG